METCLVSEPKTVIQKPRKAKPKFEKSSKFRIQPYRRMVQFGFLLTTLAIGVQFYLFVNQLEAGGIPSIFRPPGVEAFLPISSLISLKYWLMTGIFNKIHPSGLVIFLIILLTGILLKKGFCSWVCPFGLLSEYLEKLRNLVFRKKFNISKWIDIPLRSLKYLLLFFFLWAVLVKMDVVSLETFIYSPYNRIADIKMMKFFTEMSSLTFWVLTSLVILSTIIPYFWCRYLCPYGALIGSVSLASIFKIRRNVKSCIDCGKCAKACPSRIKVDQVKTVYSDECHGCLQCVDVCPVKDTMYMSAGGSQLRIKRTVYGVVIILLFVLLTLTARITGHWNNALTGEEYLYHIDHMDDPVYYHNRGEVPEYGVNEKMYPYNR